MDSSHFSHINGRFLQPSPGAMDVSAYPVDVQDDPQEKVVFLNDPSSIISVSSTDSWGKVEEDVERKQRKRVDVFFRFSALLRRRWRKKALLPLFLLAILLLIFIFIFFLSRQASSNVMSSPFGSGFLDSGQKLPKEELMEVPLHSSSPVSAENVHSFATPSLPPISSAMPTFTPTPTRGPEKRFTSVLFLGNREDTKEYVERVIRVARSIHRGGVNRHPNMYEFLVCATTHKKEAVELEEKIRQVWREEEQKVTEVCPRCFTDVKKKLKTTFSVSRGATGAGNGNQRSSFSAEERRAEAVQEEDDDASFTQVRVRVHSTGSFRRFSDGKHESSSFLLLRCVTAVKSEFFIIESPNWSHLAEKEISSSLLQKREPSFSFPPDMDVSKRFSDAVIYTQRVLNIALQTLSSNRVMHEPLVVDSENPAESKAADVFKLTHYVYEPTFQPTASLPAVPSSFMVVPGYDEMENKTYLDHVLQSFLAALEEERSGKGVRPSSAASSTSFLPSSSPMEDDHRTYHSFSLKPHQDDEEGKEETPHWSSKKEHDNAESENENYISIFWKSLPSDFYGVNRLYHCRMAPFYNLRREAVHFFPQYSIVDSSTVENEPKEDLPEEFKDESESNNNSSGSKRSSEGGSNGRKKLDNAYEEVKTTNEENPFAVVHSSTSASTVSPSRVREKTATVCELLTSSSSGMHQTFIAGPVLTFFQEFCDEWRKLVSPYRNDALERTYDSSIGYEDRDISSSLCAYEWLRTLKEQEQKYLVWKKKRQSLDKKNSIASTAQQNKVTPPFFSPKIDEGVANASAHLTKASPLHQFSDAVVNPEGFQSRSPFVLALKETTRWDRKRKSFEESLPYLQDLVLNIGLREVYWNTSHQAQLQYRWKDPNQDVICLPSNKTLWDTTPSMYRTSWFMRSISFSCLQRGALCIGKDSEKGESTMWRMKRYVSLSGKWAKGQWRVCFTGGGTHFYDPTT